jgi:Phage related hypothetical protein (DUF1799)
VCERRGRDATKKLKAAAVAWVSGGRGGAADPDDDNADMLAAIQARRNGKSKGTGEIEVPRDEQDALALFLALGTQWKWHPMIPVRTGFDYASIAPVATATGIALTPSLFADLQIMEQAALVEFGKRVK